MIVALWRLSLPIIKGKINEKKKIKLNKEMNGGEV